MSMREEDRQKNSCPSRGLGLAAAALGVGVGAALYYFLSKRPENPDGEGSTTGWSCEQPHAFNIKHDTSNTDVNTTFSSEDSYTTISETTTTDTSVHDSCSCSSRSSESSDSDSYIDLIPDNSFESDAEDADWEIETSLDVPSDDRRSVSPVRMALGRFGAMFSPRPSEIRARRRSNQEHRDLLRAQALSEEEHIKFLNAQKFRERSWSLEECSICFEIMLKDQQLTSLPCSHNFHSACLAPWLAEQQTCPNCRKSAE